MNKQRIRLAVALAVIAGFVGGAVSSWLLTPRPVVAAETGGHQIVVTAEKFVLVDSNRKVRATWGLADDGTPRLEFLDEDGKATFQAPCAHMAGGAGPSKGTVEKHGEGSQTKGGHGGCRCGCWGR